MENPWPELQDAIEIERFSNLTDIQVVFDVGARTSLQYLEIFPDAEFHLFEPWKLFYEYLQFKTKDNPKVHVNGYALGDIKGHLPFNSGVQSFSNPNGELHLIQTLNAYIKENNITRIDFLKIDAEKWDYKVLQGGTKAIGMARYIQYETWNQEENDVMRDMLEDYYTFEDIGGRNIFCTRK